MIRIPALILLTLLCLGCNTPSNTAKPLRDADLVGYSHREPYAWDAERFGPHVSWAAPDGSEHWLFEAFIFLEGQDCQTGRNFVISPAGLSATKAEWEHQLDLWLGKDCGVGALEAACAKTAGRIGNPPAKRKVIIGLPDAIMFERFSDKNSSTIYWGDGLDFAKVEDRLKALDWYMNEVRSRFAGLDCRYVELDGFYITSEEIYLPYDIDVNCRYKNWEDIAPALAERCHSKGEKLYWIPYHLAPGHKYWKQLGIDQAWMQPNWYWDLKAGERHPFDKTLKAMEENGLGMELEFEYSCVADQMKSGVKGPDGEGRLIFDAADVPALQGRVREYMRRYREAGLLGKGSIALYSGSDALTQLATSQLPQDKALYDELCAFVLENRGEFSKARVSVDDAGMLTELSLGGRNYAGGYPLWRLYYNTPEQKEIEISGRNEKPASVRVVGDTTYVEYTRVGGKAFELNLKIWTEGAMVRFSASLRNDEPHTIVRELQYPLLGDMHIPEDYKLLTTHTGGQIFDNPVWKISNVDVRPLYMTPAQKFRQYDLQYPRNAAANCFAFVGERDGLYFGSHDTSLQQTWHGLRTYPDEISPLAALGRDDKGNVISSEVEGGVEKSPIGHVTEDFKHLEAGFYRYPNAMCGDTWSNDASVIVPYEGDWTATSRIYRRWADSWWHHDPVPQWVQDMTGWQRIIFKHQYGEYLRTYGDLPGRIAAAGESVGCNAVLAFGWWDEGMDNGYPNYSPDASQGGDEALKKAIAIYRQGGASSEHLPVNRLLLYFNGRLIDVESDFYRNGGGSRVANKDNTGREFTEHYKFTGEGTTLGYYDSRTFVIADMSKREWRDQLIRWADRAMSLGADAVFYDQLGVAEEFPGWDLSREYPVQDIFTGRYKADALKEIRDHIKARNPEFALGTEWLSDCTSQFCDFVHIVEFTALPESFPEWFRYTFPEVIWSDRCVRDDNDVPRRVNNTLLKGLRNDIEVFRCRGLIDETPVYQAHLAKINAIRHDFPELLLEGRFTATEGFGCSNPKLIARSYTAENRLAVVVTNTGEKKQKGKITVPGYKLIDSRRIGGKVSGNSVILAQNDIAVLIFEKQ